jgi:hypothetical protein
MSYPSIIKEAALEKLFHTDLSLRHIADELGIPLDARRKVCGGIGISDFKRSHLDRPTDVA